MITQRMKSSELHSRLLLALVAVIVMFMTACQIPPSTKTTVAPKSAANETAAIGALRTISSAETTYSVSRGGEFGTFEELVKGGNLDARFGGERPVVGGYVFTIKVTPGESGSTAPSYAVNADPQENVAAGSTGSRHFYMDSTDSAIRVNAKQSASSSDSQL